MRTENMAKNALNAVRLPKFEPVNGKSWSPRKMMIKDLRQRSGLAWFCACAESCVVFNTGPYTVLPNNSISITANMQSEMGFPRCHQLKSYVASKSRLKLAARCPVSGCWPSCVICCSYVKSAACRGLRSEPCGVRNCTNCSNPLTGLQC